MVDGPRWWSSSTSPRGSSDWRGVPQRAPVRPTSRLRSRPKTETPTSSDLVADLIGGEVDTSVTPNAPHRSSWHTSLLPHPIFPSSTSNSNSPKFPRERGSVSLSMPSSLSLFQDFPHPRFIRSSKLRTLFFPRDTSLFARSPPTSWFRGFLLVGENAIMHCSRSVVPPIAAQRRRDFHLTDSRLSALRPTQYRSPLHP